MTNVQKKLIVGGIGVLVWSIGFYFADKLSKTEIYFIGAIGMFVFGVLFANNNPKVVDSAVTQGQNVVK